MPFKNLEHDGGEDFSSSTKRRKDFIKPKKTEEDIEKEELAEKERLQKEYLNPNNEALWEEW